MLHKHGGRGAHPGVMYISNIVDASERRKLQRVAMLGDVPA